MCSEAKTRDNLPGWRRLRLELRRHRFFKMMYTCPPQWSGPSARRQVLRAKIPWEYSCTSCRPENAVCITAPVAEKAGDARPPSRHYRIQKWVRATAWPSPRPASWRWPPWAARVYPPRTGCMNAWRAARRECPAPARRWRGRVRRTSAKSGSQRPRHPGTDPTGQGPRKRGPASAFAVP